MARAVEGHRRYLSHRKTINPDRYSSVSVSSLPSSKFHYFAPLFGFRKGLVDLYDKIENGELEESSTLSSLVTRMHKSRQGSPRKRYGSLPGMKGRNRLRTEESFYENPLPECICRN
ncbi:hypothetical protein IHE45_10G067100 [Dioscorea alata]|uniref:Uncharacterized protein n=1 Tax=Dioscorea alata TaxID=55571 RepID=A0ACB7VC01_DIOAL|nr:hypothetical protein IHE45_10G067100 [Dioscorea alata]